MSVASIDTEREGLQRVTLHNGEGTTAPAYVLTKVIGPVAAGDHVIVNTTAVDLGLGTGGSHVVHWNLSRDEWSEPGGGHIMKMRYATTQIDTGVVEESPEYEAPETLDRMPVVACLLHSQMPIVAAVIKALQPNHRVVYVMTDQAALPYALSDVAFAARQAGVIDCAITAGQAFGGDLEAVNVTSALGIARAQNADVVIVAEGPGVVGTNSPIAFSALEMAAVLDQTRQYGGRPILALRWSDVDTRPRHKGVSHHNMSVLDRAVLPVHVGVPGPGERITSERHVFSTVEVPDVAQILHNFGLDVRTMGRTIDDDPGFFRFTAAAGVLAAGFA